ncbi:MAG TPA: type II secretion system protein GspG [Nitrospirales bacterium]|nr:type II secretion system protein GspG [Nitrospirales bacterium]HIA14910.1 type II secretion system protein GspG [Nitrospirales bacterium]HIB53374.1 type II secretion system protein GspG [Nitrospirales bacterium]HIC05050.1 type II secretion system protein GspG [Nitrospirales bacterium]HIN33395.1 type II secretion system protein GspG [Nitrospirales bacterium]
MRDQRGFTFVEIMVVVAILAILAAIVVPRIMGRTDEAKITAAKVQMRNIEGALKLYKLDTGKYPPTEHGLEALITKPTSGKVPKNWRRGGYLQAVPKDPWGTPFLYLSPGVHDDYDLVSNGSDGEPGGEGEEADIQSWNFQQ